MIPDGSGGGGGGGGGGMSSRYERRSENRILTR